MSEPLRGVWGVPPGADFSAELVRGLSAATKGQPPEALSRITVFLPNHRMLRRVTEIFASGPAALLPRLRLLSDPAPELLPCGSSSPGEGVRRQLDLARLVRGLLEADPSLSPLTAALDLAGSLASLMDEMAGEGVPAQALEAIDVGGLSDHWSRSLAFLRIATEFDRAAPPGPEARRRAAVAALTAHWQGIPPSDPVVVAGSTGSRGTTSDLIRAVHDLPNGCIVLPGFDFDLPADVWETLFATDDLEEHPQFRLASLLRRLSLRAGSVDRWRGAPPDPERNRVLSLALRPAPVTDQWAREGPRLADPAHAMRNVTLVEAPSEQAEAAAIALRLRKAAEDGMAAALVTPDRILARRVSAALGRWGIRPDDSAGRPMGLTAPGRLLRHVADRMTSPVDPASALVLLKHPLTNSEAIDARGPHLLAARSLERFLRRSDGTRGLEAELARWSAREDRQAWAGWVAETVLFPEGPSCRTLGDWMAELVSRAEALVAGPAKGTSASLWAREAGSDTRAALQSLSDDAVAGEEVSAADFLKLLSAALSGETRAGLEVHPEIMIWGTLEARGQSAELMILGGLNEGTWPEPPGADPWLNRTMRRDLGMLLPERRIGLSAHDFQQAASASEIWITRALRDAETETVASRWLLRLENLLSGLAAPGSEGALGEMRARGRAWLARADAIDRRVATSPPEPRPAPAPRPELRPKRLSVTEISTLIRDPYAIYARHVLGLKKLDPLSRSPDARDRGNVLHGVMEEAFRNGLPEDHRDAADRILAIAERHLAALPWPAVTALWRARLARVLPDFLEGEDLRREAGSVAALEAKGDWRLDDPPFALVGKADRIDRLDCGGYAIWDYKTGKPPTPPMMELFDPQLPLEAMMLESGGFEGVPAAPVRKIGHIGLGADAIFRPVDTGEFAWPPSGKNSRNINFGVATTRERFASLIERMLQPSFGFASRRSMEKVGFEGDFDHLARFGEWSESDPPKRIDLP